MDREVLDLRLEILGRRHLDTISATANLANTLHHRGLLEEAERMKRGGLDLRIEILGRRHADTLEAMDSLACTLYKRDQLEAATNLWQEMTGLRDES